MEQHCQVGLGPWKKDKNKETNAGLWLANNQRDDQILHCNNTMEDFLDVNP